MSDEISKVDYDELIVTHSPGQIADLLREADEYSATLARQLSASEASLAEAKANADSWEEQANDRVKEWAAEYELRKQVESQLAEAQRVALAIQDERIARQQVESQLAEANRRLDASQARLAEVDETLSWMMIEAIVTRGRVYFPEILREKLAALQQKDNER